MILGPHKGVLKALIWKYKYKFISDISIPLGGLMRERYGEFLLDKRFLVTYAPSCADREKWRGFNQAELLAQKVSNELDLRCINSLYKENHVVAQVGHSRRERLANMAGKIRYIGNKDIENKKILVIDDVYTTGATLEECAKVLRAAGYREVWGLVLSRD